MAVVAGVTDDAWQRTVLRAALHEGLRGCFIRRNTTAATSIVTLSGGKKFRMGVMGSKYFRVVNIGNQKNMCSLILLLGGIARL